MKGLIFNLLEEVVRREYGDDIWEDMLETAAVDGAYSSLGSYPDGEITKLISAAASALDLEPDLVIRQFGRHALPLLASKYPHFFERHKTTRTFLLSLNDVIHAEVRKIYSGAEVPEFDYDASSPDVLVMGYTSPRRLCALAQGFTEGAAAHFGEEVIFEQPQCMNRGDPKCVFQISFKKRP
jgi:Haem-NO-binding